VKSLLLIAVSVLSALVTGWLAMVIIAYGFCSGYQPNWLCSGHGGGLVGIALLVIVVSLPIYFVVFRYLLNKRANKDGGSNR